MGYAQIADVQARMPQFTLTSTSKPTLGDSEVFLSEAESQVEATLENLGYSVPITGEKSVVIVRGLVVALTIVFILQARAAAVGGDAATSSSDRAQKWYNDRLKALMDPRNPLELTDADRTDARMEKPIDLVLGLLEDACGNSIEPRVTMDQKF